MPPRSLLAALLLVCCPTAWAQPPAAPVETRAPVVDRAPLAERSAQEASELARALPLQAEYLNTDFEDFLALWLPANSGTPTGVAILLPGAGENADWPVAIAPLRTRLPDHGWHTLSLTLPDPNDALTPSTEPGPALDQPGEGNRTQATTANETETETDDRISADKPQDATGGAATPATEPTAESPSQAERIDARLDAALAFARARHAGTIVLIGHGTGAYWASRYLSEHSPEEVRHLVLIAPRTAEGQRPPLEQLAPALTLAIGDFHYRDSVAIAAAIVRRDASRRLQHADYSQVALQALPGDREAEQERLYRRVRGWLDKHVRP